jgi:predicted permease
MRMRRHLWVSLRPLDSLAQDIRYGLRQIVRAPMFSAVAILSLAIGIGASAAVFSLADRMLLRKLPLPDPDALIILKWASGPAIPFSSLNGNSDRTDVGFTSTAFSLPAFRQMREAARDAVSLAGFADLYQVNVVVDGRAEILNANAVSAEYFGVLGLSAGTGRLLGAADDRTDAAPAAVISDVFSRRRFGGPATAVGRTIAINGVPFAIAGVTPPGFSGTGQVLDAPAVWVPLTWRGRLLRDSGQREDDPTFWWVLILGRLRPGVAATRTQPVLEAILKRGVAESKPQLAAKDLPRLDVLDGSRGQYENRDGMRGPLRTMALVVAIVLLVACANVANLLLARGRARARELAVRTALGASRARVIRQLLTEGALLAAGGALLGGIAARWITQALMPALTLAPDLPVAAMDWRLLAFVTALAAGCAMTFALAPALRSTRLTLTAGLQESGRRGITGPRRRLAGSLVVAQIALSMVLVVTAALLVRSLRNLGRAELGFDAANVLTFRIDPSLNGYPPDRVRALCSELLERLRHAPGVVAASFTSHPLLAHSVNIGIAALEEERLPTDLGSEEAQRFRARRGAWRLIVSPGFFDTMRLPIVRGRALDERDAAGGQRTAVVNRLLARKLFDTEDVIGRRFRQGLRQTSPVYEIVGVAGNARYAAVREDMPPTFYVAAAQQPPGSAAFEVRTAGAAEAFAPTAADIVRQIDDQLPLVGMRTLTDQIARSLEQERLVARLAVLLGLVTLSLCAIGLYGLLSYSVTQRVPEIGVRMALGAERGAVRWMVLRQSLVLAATGLALGAGAALLVTRTVESILYGLPPRDPVTFMAAAAVMMATCLFAASVPARRASRVDPIVALRAE